MKLSSSPLWLSCGSIALYALARSPASAQGQTLGDLWELAPANRGNIRWASSGGGWRAMFASIGFANVFQQAGLFSNDSSKFSAIVSYRLTYS